MNLTEFVNKTEMVSFSALFRTIVYSIVALMFSVTACIIMLQDSEKYMTWGLQLALAVLGGLTVASGVGAYNTKTIRESSDKYAPVLEAKERGKVAGAAAAVAIREQAMDAQAKRTNGVATADHAAVQINNSEKTVIKPQDDESGTE